MLPEPLDELVSPTTAEPLRAEGDALVAESGERFPIRGGIPRFVEDPAYAESFGDQWRRYRLVQLDSQTGRPLSRQRLFESTGWSPDELAGERVLEAGCGAGRFTEVLLEVGAEVWAIDATSAVDACWENNYGNPRLAVAQADIYALPFGPRSFDRVICYGVLQHTPDPKRAFLSVVEMARPEGLITADVYRTYPYINRTSSKRLWRPLTTRMPRALLRRIVEWYVPKWMPIDTHLERVPKLGRFLVAVVPCWNYTNHLDLTQEQLRAWAILDTFDALAPKYDRPQTIEAVAEWCHEAGLEDADVRYGGNGILINGRRPA